MSANPPPAATNPESATTALYRAALGPVHTAHYLAVFERFDEAGRSSPVWNGAAGLLTLNWMVFRQLWRAALVYLACTGGLALLALVLGRQVLQWPPGVAWGVSGTLLLLGIVIPGAYGNAILHADIRRRMTRAVSAARTVREACATLEKQASSKRRLWLLVLVNVLLALGAVVAGLGLKPGMAAAVAEAIDMPGLAVPAAASAEPVMPAPEPTPAAQPVAVSLPPPAEPAPAAEPAPVIVSPPVLPAPEPTVASTPPVPSPQPPAEPPSVATPVLAPARTPAPTKVPAPKEPNVDVPQAHGINVGLFADPANAEKAHARLIGAGMPAILQTVDSPKGARTRVRVGPFAGRAQADEAAARIRDMGLDAVVFAP